MKLGKPTLKTRGIRISDRDWNTIERIAMTEARKSGKNITASDVVRHAIESFLEKELVV